ncbi:histone H1.0-A-like protein, partial [Aphelenchoides avenae]
MSAETATAPNETLAVEPAAAAPASPKAKPARKAAPKKAAPKKAASPKKEKAAAPKPKKEKVSKPKPKPAAPGTHPAYNEMIAKAITSLKEKKGSSRAAILKYILQNFK